MTKLHELYQPNELKQMEKDLRVSKKIISDVLKGDDVQELEWYYIEMMIHSLRQRLGIKDTGMRYT
ncbi:hypothetical protein EGH82_23710, partial [Vibrio ponticus]